MRNQRKKKHAVAKGLVFTGNKCKSLFHQRAFRSLTLKLAGKVREFIAVMQ